MVGGDAGKRLVRISISNRSGEDIVSGRLVIGNLTNAGTVNPRALTQVTTLAGSGVAGGANGLGTAATFTNPTGLALGPGPFMYVTDWNGHTVRRLDLDGMTSAFVGAPGVFGTTDGTGGAARFRRPDQIAVDGAGNVFVADSYNHTIRRVTPLGEVTTIAGLPGTSGTADGPGTMARFNTPIGIAVTQSGDTIYVSDALNHTIRRITYSSAYGPRDVPDAYTVSTLAGSPGVSGLVDDVGGDARFNYPAHLALDTSETSYSTVLYVADYFNHAIRRVEVPYLGDGRVSTIAGNGTAGSTDGPGSIARFSGPYGIAIVAREVYDPQPRRIIYVAEHSGSRLRAIIPVPGNEPTQAGNYRVVALAGGVAGYLDGDGTAARFSAPHGIAAVATNKESTTLFVADYSNHRIRKVNVASSDLISGVSGPAEPEPVRVVNWSSERPNQAAWVIDFPGFVSYPYVPGGLPNNTTTTVDVQFYVPRGIAGFSFTVYTEGDSSLINYPAQGASWLTTLGGDGTPGLSDGPGKLAQFNAPRGIVAVPTHLRSAYSPLPSIRAIVADTFNSRIRYIDMSGNVGTYAGSTTGSADGEGLDAQFNWPRAVAVAPDGSVLVADGDNHRIRRIVRTAAGVVVTTIAGTGVTGNTDGRGDVATFSIPAGIAVDAGGTIYVTDSFSHIVRRIDRIGGDPALPTSYQVVTVAGTAGSSGSADGVGAAARFNAPTGIAVGGDGRVYVADTNNHTIRLLTRATATTMAASTLAGLAGTAGYVDAAGAAARFNAPYGVTVDRANNVYVTDRLNYRVRRVSPLGDVKTLIGTGAAGSADGPNGTLNSAAGISVEPGGSLLIVDYTRHSVRVLQRMVTDAQP